VGRRIESQAENLVFHRRIWYQFRVISAGLVEAADRARVIPSAIINSNIHDYSTMEDEND
jgi:hypothetical protein